MYELRLVKDGAPAIGMMADGSKKIYLQSDTIPIESEWTVEQAAVLLKLPSKELGLVGRWYADNKNTTGHIDAMWTIYDGIKDLISLSLAHKASGLSLEQFIEGMKEYSNTGKTANDLDGIDDKMWPFKDSI